MAAPRLDGVLETCLYVDGMARARSFYEDVLGLTPMLAEERLTAYPVGASVLLLFLRGATRDPIVLPEGRGLIPPHDGKGPLHFAFAIAADALEAWRRRFAECGVAVVSEARWPRGGRSLYVHDPDGHVVELATPGLWRNG